MHATSRGGGAKENQGAACGWISVALMGSHFGRVA